VACWARETAAVGRPGHYLASPFHLKGKQVFRHFLSETSGLSHRRREQSERCRGPIVRGHDKADRARHVMNSVIAKRSATLLE